MTDAFKKLSMVNSSAHIKEFGNSVGTIIGYADYNNCNPSDSKYDLNKVGPEVEVRWDPYNLRYIYPIDALEEVEIKLPTQEEKQAAEERLRKKGRAISEKEKWEVITRLVACWEKKPTLRLGQFISSIPGVNNLFNIEDFELVEKAENWK